MNHKDSQTNQVSQRKKSMSKRILRRLFLIPLIAIGGLFFLSMTAKKPNSLGAANGSLAACPPSPNCVSTTAELESQKMPAIQFADSPQELREKIKASVSKEFPRAKLITESESYLHFEFTSLIFRFVDDVEFLINDKEAILHFRSASRVGHSDLGANRKRMTKICESLNP